jgi:hypothetical protein
VAAQQYGMRVVCECGRRLLDVTRERTPSGRYQDVDYNPGFLTVRARPGVELRKYHGEVGARGTTYTVVCSGAGMKCGRTYSKAAKGIWETWQDREAQANLVTVILGIDM